MLNAQPHIPKFAQSNNRVIKDLAFNVENNGWLYFRKNSKLKGNSLFTTHREAMGLQPNDRMKLQKNWRDELGYSHSRYQQYYKSIEVMYGSFTEHFARNDDNMYLANGRIIEDLDIDISPSVRENPALENALKYLGAAEYAWQDARMERELKEEKADSNATYFPKGKLVIAPVKSEIYTKENYKLSWQFEILSSRPEAHQIIFVDAHSGKVIKVAQVGHNNGPAQLRYYGTREIDTQWRGGFHYNFRLYANDDTRDIVTKIGGSTLTSFSGEDNVTDADDVWNSTDTAIINATTAHWVTSKAWDFYENTFSRWGASGTGAYLRVWSDSPGGTQAKIKANDWFLQYSVNPNGNTEATLDIAGHEFTHVVLHYEDGPGSQISGPSGENGALAESLGDIMGFMVERKTLGDNNTNNFTHGEDCGQIFRNFANPSSVTDIINGVPTTHPSIYNGTNWIPTNSSFDGGGIHFNCSVQNHWFYLLGNGRTGTGTGLSAIAITGIGFDKAAQIVYKSMTSGGLTQSSNFFDARISSINAATQLFGSCSIEVQQTAKAWAAVGVGSTSVCPPSISPSSPYGSVVCVNNPQYPYELFASEVPGATFTWSYPSNWSVQIVGNQLIINNFGAIYNGESAVVSATSSSGQVGSIQIVFADCSNDPLLKTKISSSNLKISLFPNPATDLLSFKSNVKKEGKIDIYDSIGRLMFTKKIGANENFVDVSTLKNGIYLLKMSIDDQFSNASFYKN
jgi:bacillolysin